MFVSRLNKNNISLQVFFYTSCKKSIITKYEQ